MTHTVLTPQMPPSWMLALAEGRGHEDAPTAGVRPVSMVDCATRQLHVVRMLLDWVRLEDAAQLAGNADLEVRRERGRAISAAAQEAATFIAAPSDPAPEGMTNETWKDHVSAREAWSQANVAIGAFAGVRANESKGRDLLQRDALRTAAQDTARHVRAAATALEQAGYQEYRGALCSLAEAFESVGGLKRGGSSRRFDATVHDWAQLVPPPALSSGWWAGVVATQRTLAEALSSWLDGIGAGGDVTENLSADRAPLREAALLAAQAAVEVACTRAADTTARNWEAQGSAARALASAAADTDRVTHAGTTGFGPIDPAKERPLDQRQLEITAAAAASTWFDAAAQWAALGEDTIAHACRSSAVALGAVSVLDGITAATLGWAAREAWRSVAAG